MNRRVIPVLLPLTLLGVVLAGCAVTAEPASVASTTTAAVGETTTDETSVDADIPAAAAELLAANADGTVVRDDEWSLDDAADVSLSGSSAATDAAGVSVDGGTVTISAAGVYRLSGHLDGQIVVAAPDDALVVLVLDRATITNGSGAGIHVVSADDVAINVAAGSTNSVTGASSADAEASAAISADTDLTVSGSGSLAVTDSGNDGISSTDDLAVIGGTITVTAADDALRGKDSLVVKDGALTLSAGGDALKSDQTDDETKGYVWIAGGTVSATATDDGIDAQTDAIITAGTVGLATDDDGIHSEVALAIAGGEVTISRSYEGIESADIRIAGGHDACHVVRRRGERLGRGRRHRGRHGRRYAGNRRDRDDLGRDARRRRERRRPRFQRHHLDDGRGRDRLRPHGAGQRRARLERRHHRVGRHARRDRQLGHGRVARSVLPPGLARRLGERLGRVDDPDHGCLGHGSRLVHRDEDVHLGGLHLERRDERPVVHRDRRRRLDVGDRGRSRGRWHGNGRWRRAPVTGRARVDEPVRAVGETLIRPRAQNPPTDAT
ncbi:carbohydrate-binding domain-containing protein [Microbacterium lacticum]